MAKPQKPNGQKFHKVPDDYNAETIKNIEKADRKAAERQRNKERTDARKRQEVFGYRSH